MLPRVSSAPPLTTAAHTLTIEEWAELPDDQSGELVDGRLEEEEVTDTGHELIVLWLARQVGNWLAGKGGVVLGSDAKYRVRANRGRKPDLAVFLPGGKRAPRTALVRIPPEIMVEVVSARPRDGRRDRIEKAVEYASFGVRWYWLLDPQLQSLEVWELRDGVYAHVLAASESKVTDIPGCPELVLDLDELWSELELLGPEEPEPESETP